MAFIANPATIDPGEPKAFEPLYHPGTTTPYSGIYRCLSCGWEAVSTAGHPLPPQTIHHRHGLPILWQLVVGARHR